MWQYFGSIWALNEKVSFDGAAKQIRVNADATVIDVKIDLYSAWKRWVQLDDHAKFLPAMRTIGGDPVGGGLFAGDIYFLTNGWQVVVDHQIQVVGTLYHDDPVPVYVLEPLGGVTAQTSNLAYSLAGPSVDVPSTEDIASAVWDDPFAAGLSSALSANTVALNNLNLKVDIVSMILRNKTVTDPDTGLMTVYAEDGVTPTLIAQIFEDVSGNQAYRGQGVQRRERLE
jgi:hypothetical protein